MEKGGDTVALRVLLLIAPLFPACQCSNASVGRAWNSRQRGGAGRLNGGWEQAARRERRDMAAEGQQ